MTRLIKGSEPGIPAGVLREGIASVRWAASGVDIMLEGYIVREGATAGGAFKGEF